MWLVARLPDSAAIDGISAVEYNIILVKQFKYNVTTFFQGFRL